MKPLLVVEVADSSLRIDLGEKRALYARAGVPEYWVLDLKSRRLEVFREPEDGAYGARLSLAEKDDARVAPERWPEVELLVSSLLPHAPG